MKIIYLVNRFNLKNETDSVVKRLRELPNHTSQDYEIVVNDTIEQAQDTLETFKDTDYSIVAIGGDGTINQVVNALVGTKNVFSYIPYGTGNDFHRTIVESGLVGLQELDLVRINERYFINVACFGIDADIANDDRFIHNKWIPKPLRYVSGVLYHFLKYGKGRHLKVEWDHHHAEGDMTTVVVSNAQYYGGGFHVSPTSQLNDGKLEVLMVNHLNRFKMAKVILTMQNASHLKHSSVKLVETSKLTIKSNTPIEANIDGEKISGDKFEIDLLPKSLKININQELWSHFLKR